MVYLKCILLLFQCPPCKAFIPQLIHAYDNIRNRIKFEIIFVSSDRYCIVKIINKFTISLSLYIYIVIIFITTTTYF